MLCPPIRLGSPKRLGHEHARPSKFRNVSMFRGLKSLGWFRSYENLCNLRIIIVGLAESHCGLWQK